LQLGRVGPWEEGIQIYANEVDSFIGKGYLGALSGEIK